MENDAVSSCGADESRRGVPEAYHCYERKCEKGLVGLDREQDENFPAQVSCPLKVRLSSASVVDSAVDDAGGYCAHGSGDENGHYPLIHCELYCVQRCSCAAFQSSAAIFGLRP